MRSLFHPSVNTTTFCECTKKLYPNYCTGVLWKMKFAIDYDDPSYIDKLNIAGDQLSKLMSIYWHTSSYAEECYIHKCYRLCIFFLKRSYSVNLIILFLQTPTSATNFSSLLLKCIHEEEEIANKIINTLWNICGKLFLKAVHNIWEANLEIRYFTIIFTEEHVLKIKPIPIGDRYYDIHNHPINLMKQYI
jgi:hypothetical protein